MIENERVAQVNPLARGTVLLHIGPPKTGTSALQSACHAQRDRLKAAGVHYAGAGVQPSAAAFAAIARAHPSTGRAPSRRHWESLVREVRGVRNASVLISSEFFAGADEEQARAVVAALGGDRVHIAVTLRPLAKILGSRWQQNVQEGAHISYVDWLGAVLNEPNSSHAQRFWSRQRHDALIARWVSATAPNRLHVIVVDDRDHVGILRSFEQLLGVPEGTLAPHRDALNRSLTLEEVEAVRAFNEQFDEAKLAPSLRHKLMARGAATHLKRRTPDPSEAKIVTPAWAVDRALEIGAEMVATIESSGVNVDGDLSLLSRESSRASASSDPITIENVAIRPEIAARMAMGILFASGATHGYEERSRVPAWGEPYDLQRVTTLQLVSVAVQRTLSAAWRRIRRLRR